MREWSRKRFRTCSSSIRGVWPDTARRPLPTRCELGRYADSGVRVFLAAYGSR
jgi:hypothetical protein